MKRYIALLSFSLATVVSQPALGGLCVDTSRGSYDCDQSTVSELVYVKVEHDKNHLFFFSLDDLKNYEEPGVTPPRDYGNGSVIEDHLPPNGNQILSLKEMFIDATENNGRKIEAFRKKKGKGGVLLAMAESAMEGAGAFIDGARQMALKAGYTELELVIKGEDGSVIEINWDLEKDDMSVDMKSAETVEAEREKAKKERNEKGNQGNVDPDVNARDAWAVKQIVDAYNSSLPHGTVRIIDHKQVQHN